MLRDRHRLRQQLRGVEQALRGGRAGEDMLSRLVGDVRRSAEVRRLRQVNLPKPTFPEQLPVVGRRNYPLLFDREAERKEPYDAVIRVLNGE